MIPRLPSKSENGNGCGRSFRDLSRYLVSGKEGENNPARLMWAEGVNTYSSDPTQAWAEMAFLAENQGDLKRAAKAAGLIAKNARTDQEEETPVWHAVLSWHPDDRPDRARMMEAARSFMKFHGLEKHQFVVFAHGDGDAPHLHIMANLIHPETGLSAKRHLTRVEGKGQSGLLVRCSEWAGQWEKAHPDERAAPGRAQNWEKRRENALAVKALKALNQSRALFGKAPLPMPKLLKAFDKSPSRSVWQTMKGIAIEAGRFLAGVEGGREAINAARAHFADEHRRAFAVHYEAKAAEREQRRADAAQIDRVLHLATRQQSTFTRADLAKAIDKALGGKYGREQFNALLAKVEASPDLIRIKTEQGERFTSNAMHDVEKRLLASAIIMANSHGHALPENVLRDVRARIDARPEGQKLTDEQRAAFEHVTGSHGLALVVGRAGAGKSTMLEYARHAWEGAGFNVIGAAFSGRAADALEGSSGIKSRTVASIDYAMRKKGFRFGPRDVLVVDEAGMLGSREWARLIEAARAGGAKVVAVGDWNQKQSILAGGAFRVLTNDPTIGAAQISEVMRQGSHVRGDAAAWASFAWQREATKAMGDGDMRAGLMAYHARGCVHEHETRADARAATVAAWWSDHEKGHSAAMMAATRAEVRKLNEDARGLMRKAGRLGKDTTITAYERNDEDENAPRPVRLTLAEGERVMFTKNDTRLGVRNGTLGTLAAMEDGRLTVRLDGSDARAVTVDLSQYAYLAHGYAASTTKNQGITVDRAHYLAAKTMNSDRHEAYVALSRHRAAVLVHYGRDEFKNLNALVRHLSRDGLKRSTTDYIAAPEIGELQARAIGRDMRHEGAEIARILGGGDQIGRAHV